MKLIQKGDKTFLDQKEPGIRSNRSFQAAGNEETFVHLMSNFSRRLCVGELEMESSRLGEPLITVITTTLWEVDAICCIHA